MLLLFIFQASFDRVSSFPFRVAFFFLRVPFIVVLPFLRVPFIPQATFDRISPGQYRLSSKAFRVCLPIFSIPQNLARRFLLASSHRSSSRAFHLDLLLGKNHPSLSRWRSQHIMLRKASFLLAGSHRSWSPNVRKVLQPPALTLSCV